MPDALWAGSLAGYAIAIPVGPIATSPPASSSPRARRSLCDFGEGAAGRCTG
jgi:hypothetical protein